MKMWPRPLVRLLAPGRRQGRSTSECGHGLGKYPYRYVGETKRLIFLSARGSGPKGPLFLL